MEVHEDGQIMYNIKVSSVGPGKVTEPPGRVVDPGNMDLAMKLHYLRGVYYFGSLAFGGVTTLDVKSAMFTWLNHHPITCARFSRHHQSRRPYTKCNDCGVRFVEASCVHTLHDWLQQNNDTLLSSHQPIGPHLSFSPLVYIQLTRFKCGGAAVGLSWAHVLGDAFSAAEFMNSLGRVVAGFGPERPTYNLLGHVTPTVITKYTNGEEEEEEEPMSIKRVDPVGDNWSHVAESEMEAFRFVVSPAQVSHLRAKSNDSPPFEAITALVWRCIAKIRAGELEPRVVTIVCKTSTSHENSIGNSQVVSVVKAGFPIVGASPGELAALVRNEALDERRMIEDAMERDCGLADYIVYGANLTFVNLEEARFYDFDYRGQKPIRVSYRIDGVGEKGAVLVLPMSADEKSGGGGRSVTAILPVDEMIGFKSELKREGLISS